jgi:hypothetical protein
VTVSTRELLKLSKSYGRGSKFSNVPTTVDGIRFDSRKEARRFAELKLLERAGEIRDLEVHPRYPLTVNEQEVCVYEADFFYREKDGRVVIEDVKGVKTPVYRLKKKLMRALLGVEIRET